MDYSIPSVCQICGTREFSNKVSWAYICWGCLRDWKAKFPDSRDWSREKARVERATRRNNGVLPEFIGQPIVCDWCENAYPTNYSTMLHRLLCGDCYRAGKHKSPALTVEQKRGKEGERYRTNREQRLKYQHEYYQQNREARREYAQRYYLSLKDRTRLPGLLYRLTAPHNLLD